MAGRTRGVDAAGGEKAPRGSRMRDQQAFHLLCSLGAALPHALGAGPCILGDVLPGLRFVHAPVQRRGTA